MPTRSSSSKPSNGYRNERAFKTAILRRLRAAGFYCWSNGAGVFAKNGLPDIMGLFAQGRLFAIEAKQPGNDVTEMQSRTLDKLTASGAWTIAPHYMSEVEGFIARLAVWVSVSG